VYVLLIHVCPFVLVLVAIVLSVLRYTDYDDHFGIFKLFLLFVCDDDDVLFQLDWSTRLVNVK
jgi:hypothetical protein